MDKRCNRLKFTIVTPNYNSGKFLADTIESVICNLRPGDEYFVIDGGSTDDSVDVIRNYESYLTGWISEKDSSYSDAISKGFGFGSGEILSWINSSDLLLPKSLDCVRLFMQQSDVEWIFGDDYYIDENGVVLFRSYGGARNLRNLMLYGGWTPLQDSCFWRRSIYDSVGGINACTSHAADYELFLNLALKGRYIYLPIAFSAYRRHHNQISIRDAKHYHKQKNTIMNRMKKSQKTSIKLIFIYQIWVRLRARIFQPLWNSRSQRGMNISSIVTDCSATP